MEELSLLVWLSRGSKKTLIKLMCEYTGCEPDVYTDNQVISLFEHALVDISRKYHLKSLLYEYFSARRIEMDLVFFYPTKYTKMGAEINALGSAMFSIMPTIFDEEDLNTIERLRKEYLEKVEGSK